MIEARLGATDTVTLVTEDLTHLHRNPAGLDVLMQTLEAYKVQLATAANMGNFG